MNSHFLPALLAAFSSLFLLPCSLVFAQGNLTPPGSVTPLQKSLSQLEPRIDLATLGSDGTAAVVVDQPGSYYLSANLSAGALTGIAVNASDVVIDLRGFAISGSGGAGSGITSLAD